MKKNFLEKMEFIAIKRIIPLAVVVLGFILVLNSKNNHLNNIAESVVIQIFGFLILIFGLFLLSKEIVLVDIYKILFYIFALLFISALIFFFKKLFQGEWNTLLYSFFSYCFFGSISFLVLLRSNILENE